jgi:hypothetical protein
MAAAYSSTPRLQIQYEDVRYLNQHMGPKSDIEAACFRHSGDLIKESVTLRVFGTTLEIRNIFDTKFIEYGADSVIIVRFGRRFETSYDIGIVSFQR